jgi:hypothetical protein
VLLGLNEVLSYRVGIAASKQAEMDSQKLQSKIDQAGNNCRSACPDGRPNFDPLGRRILTVALAPSELVGVAETGRARVV